jgi:hypothetical protein
MMRPGDRAAPARAKPPIRPPPTDRAGPWRLSESTTTCLPRCPWVLERGPAGRRRSATLNPTRTAQPARARLDLRQEPGQNRRPRARLDLRQEPGQNRRCPCGTPSNARSVYKNRVVITNMKTPMSELTAQMLPDVQWNAHSSSSCPFLRFMPKMPATMVPTLTANVKI